MFIDVRRLIPWALAALVIAASVPPHDARAATGTRGRVNVCLAAEKGATDFITKSFRLGGFDCATVYQTIGKEDRLAYRRFPREVGMLLVLRFPQDGKKPNLRLIAEGRYDASVRKLARMIKADGRPVMLRILPEFNGNWYAWGTHTRGNDPADFIPAWRRTVKLLRSELGDLARFDLNYNRFSATGPYTADFAALYPGDEWVDQVSISSYNRCGLQKGKGELAHSFEQDIAPAYDAIVKIVGPHMPIAVAETSTTDECAADKKVWFAELFDSVKWRFTRITNITFFFVEKLPGTASSEAVIKWQLENTAQYDMFSGLLKEFRDHLGMTPPEAIIRVPSGPDIPQGMRLPWTIWGRAEFPLSSPYDPTLNPITESPFERMGLRLHYRATQEAMWNIPMLFPDTMSAGIQLNIEGVASTNWQRYWDNTITPGLRLQACDSSRIVGVEWGSTCLFLEGRHTEYLGPAPLRLQHGTDYIGVGLEFKYGGDWSNFLKGK